MTAPQEPAITLAKEDRDYLDILVDEASQAREGLGHLRDQLRNHGVAAEVDTIIQLVSETHDRTAALLAWLRRNLPEGQK